MPELQLQQIAKQEKNGFHFICVLSDGVARMKKPNNTGADWIHIDQYGFID